MPRRVDHAERRRQITDAVVRLTVGGGLEAASFREVAAEAGVSVRLVQYYFGTRDELLLSTQQHVAARAAERIAQRIAEAGDDPRAIVRAVLVSFIPTDDESREAMLMFVALHTAALLDPTLARAEARLVPQSLLDFLASQLERAALPERIDVELESALLVSLVASASQGVLDGMFTVDKAIAVVDYALDRTFS